jgi:hypothetical protein
MIKQQKTEKRRRKDEQVTEKRRTKDGQKTEKSRFFPYEMPKDVLVR